MNEDAIRRLRRRDLLLNVAIMTAMLGTFSALLLLTWWFFE